MSTIHQIYCTHCTYGSSALERREGELARRMLGYSVRAGSAEAQDLRHCYRQVEQYLYYYLPRDTPAEEKLRLTAATAPRRLIYLPASGALQLLAQICYRQTDTEGRPGSYFAHVLFRQRQERQADWSPLDCLKLWGAAGWVREDTAEIPFRLRPLGELGEMLTGAPPAIDDRVFLSFLTATSAGEFYDPAGVIPDRWRRQDAAVRRRMFAEAFDALLEAAGQQGKSLLLLIEPSMAALFFYGMLRLLPDNAVRQALSFSTFEPTPDRLCTTLAATWFSSPDKADLRPAAIRTPAALLSTIESHHLPIQHAEGAYAPWVLDRLLEGGWAAADRALEDFRAVGAESFGDLEHLAHADRLLPAMLAGQKPPQWPDAPMTTVYLRRALVQRLCDGGDPVALLRPLVGLSAHLVALELLAAVVDRPAARKAVEYLLLNLPDRQIAELLKLKGISPEDKAAALARYVSAHRELPPGCEWLWEESVGVSAAHVPSGHSLLPLLLAGLEPDAIEPFFRKSGERHFEAFLANLAEVGRTAGAARAALTRIVRSFDPSAVLRLYRRCGREFFRHYPHGEPALGDKLHELLRTLPGHLEEFSERLEVVLAAEPLLPSDLDHRAAAAWVRCRRAILDIGSLQHRRSILRLRPLGPLEDAARQMAEAIAQALPRDWFDDDREGTRKQQCLCRLSETLLKGETLLPAEVWQHAALWRKIGWCFESGKWPSLRLRAMRRRTRRRRPAVASPQPRAIKPQPRANQASTRYLFWMLFGGTIGLIVLSIGIGTWVVWAGRGSPPDVRPQTERRAENLPAADPLAVKPAVSPEAAEEKEIKIVSEHAAATESAAKKAPANTAVVQEQIVPQPTPSPADAPQQEESAQPPAQTREKPPAETAPMAAEVKPSARPEAAAEAEANTPPPASDATVINVVQIAGRLKMDVNPLRRRLDKPYVAELNILVPAASFPKRFGADQANCIVREHTADGGERTRTVGEVFKKKPYSLLDDIVRLDVRFEFDRKRNVLPGQTLQKVAETPWYPIDPIEKGWEYTIQFQPAKETLEKP